MSGGEYSKLNDIVESGLGVDDDTYVNFTWYAEGLHICTTYKMIQYGLWCFVKLQ